MDKSLIDAALGLFEVMIERGKKYDQMNKDLQQLTPEFPVQVRLIDDQVHTHLMSLLGVIFGESGLAEYFLYEQPHALVKCDGQCHCRGREWPLRTMQQLREYIYHNHKMKSEA